MAAKAAIHGSWWDVRKGVDGRFRGHDGLWDRQKHQGQKFFAELFFKKATAFFS
jgi:hypothetical protein